MENLNRHHKPQDLSDKIAFGFTKFLRFLADTFFKKKYGHREVVLQNVSSNVFLPQDNVSIVNAGNISYTNSEFSPTGDDALTADIGAMFYFDNNWEAGITWNDTALSDSQYVTNNRFNFYSEL